MITGLSTSLSRQIRRAIYYPRRETLLGQLEQAASSGLRPWRDADDNFIGWRSKRATRQRANRLLVFHGNEGCALDRADFVHQMERLRGSLWEVYLFEYPGYGAKAGIPSEAAFKRAAAGAARFLLHDKSRLFVMGESIGTGVASYIAGRFSCSIPGLLLITPFDRFVDAARNNTTVWLPPWLAVERYDNGVALRRYKGRLATVLAKKDTVVPAWSGEKLFNSYNGPKQLWVDPQASHNTVAKSSAPWWCEAPAFLLNYHAKPKSRTRRTNRCPWH